MEKTFSWQRLLITVLIVIVAMGAAGGSVWYVMDQQAKKDAEANKEQIGEVQKAQQSQVEVKKDETADWETYNGNGVTFKYPSDWKYSETKTGMLNKVDFTTPKGDSMLFEVNPGGRGLEGVRAFIIYSVKVIGEGITVTKKDSNSSETIGGNPTAGYAVITESNSGFSKNGNVYQFILTGQNHLDAPNAEDVLKQIAATFKFN